MKLINTATLIFFICFAFSFSEINERDLLLYALSHNADIQLNYSKISSDSLSLIAVKSGWLPQFSVSITPKYTLKDTAGILDNSIKITQPVIGGGTLSAEYGNTITKINHKASDYLDAMQFSFTQPLLNSAWKYADPFYAVTVQSIANKQMSLENRKAIFETLSEIRTFFWDYYAQSIYKKTYEREVTRAMDLLRIAKSRLTLGEASILDTLSASYNYNDAQQKLLDSQISAHKARNKLALALSLPPDSLVINDTFDIDIPELPEPSTLIALAKHYDQSLQIFEKISEKLVLEKRKANNSLFPSLDAIASYSLDKSGNTFFSNDNSIKNAVVGLVFSYALPMKNKLLSIKQTDLKINDNEIQKKKFLDELTIKLNELKESWVQEKQRISLAEKSKALAELQYNASKKEYELGTIERISLTDAQSKLVDSEISFTKTRIDMKKLEIILDEITGTTLQRFNIDFVR